MRTCLIIVLVLAVMSISACSSEPTTGPEAARAILDDAAQSMGGWEVLSAIERQEIVSQGNDWEPMQAIEPGVEHQINGWGRTLMVDYPNGSMHLKFDGERIYPNIAPVRFTEIINGDVGALRDTDENGDPVFTRMNPSRFATRMREFNRLAVRLLFVARDSAELTRLEDQTIEGQTIHFLQYQDGGHPVELQIDNFTKLPIRVIYTEDDPLYGDTQNELVYLDWRESQVDANRDGSPINARLPNAQVLFLNGERFREEAFRNLINNGTFEEGSFDIPQEVHGTPENGERQVSQWTLRRATLGVGYRGFAQPQNIQFDEISPGILHATGGSHHSMVVEMEDHLIVVGTPLYEERSVAVIKGLEERFTEKPIRYAIVTHFHMDHSGGVRAYAAKGATILGHESIVPFLETVLASEHTFRPDSLQNASDTNPSIQGVSDPLELTDGTRTVEIHHVANEHATGMLIAYVGDAKTAFVSDLYSPGRPVDAENVNALAFYRAITAAALDVRQVVGGHGGVGPFRNLARVMANVKD